MCEMGSGGPTRSQRGEDAKRVRVLCPLYDCRRVRRDIL